MTDIQNKLLDLLTDLDRICKQEGITYYLCSETALSAYNSGSFFPDCSQLSVAMEPDQAQRFIAAVAREGRTDRITDSMCSNKYYPDFTVRYCDPDTMMMQLPYNSAAALPCLGVTIHMIRRKPKRFGLIYKYTKLFWKVCTKPAFHYKRTRDRIAVGICQCIRTVLGGKHFGKGLFKLWSKLFSFNKKSKLLAIAGDKFQFPKSFVGGTSELTLEGRSFSTFDKIEEYLQVAYGEKYAQARPKYTVPSDSVLISVVIPYTQYVQVAKERGIDFETIQRNKFAYDSQQRKVSKYNRRINRYYAIVDRTAQRYAMYEKYMPMKDQLLKLHEQKQYDTLAELLAPYLAELHAFSRQKLGLCFDKEIFDLTMDLLCHEGEEAYANQLRSLVPEQHWQDMEITNYKGEPV